MRVSREFKANFDLVARFFNLLDLGELEEAKAAVRRDPVEAGTCYAALGAWVRRQAVLPSVDTKLPVITDEQIDARPRAYGPAQKR